MSSERLDLTNHPPLPPRTTPLYSGRLEMERWKIQLGILQLNRAKRNLWFWQRITISSYLLNLNLGLYSFFPVHFSVFSLKKCSACVARLEVKLFFICLHLSCILHTLLYVELLGPPYLFSMVPAVGVLLPFCWS